MPSVQMSMTKGNKQEITLSEMTSFEFVVTWIIMGTRMACWSGFTDNKKESVLSRIRSRGNHGNCSKNVKQQILGSQASQSH